MRVIYTSEGMSKKFGVRVIYRKIRYIQLVCAAAVKLAYLKTSLTIHDSNMVTKQVQ